MNRHGKPKPRLAVAIPRDGVRLRRRGVGTQQGDDAGRRDRDKPFAEGDCVCLSGERRSRRRPQLHAGGRGGLHLRVDGQQLGLVILGFDFSAMPDTETQAALPA
jgi:hypothetical protein